MRYVTSYFTSCFLAHKSDLECHWLAKSDNPEMKALDNWISNKTETVAYIKVSQ